LLQRHADPVCRSVGVLGEEYGGAGFRVGSIDAGVGTDEAVTGLGDHQVAPAPQHLDGLPFHQLPVCGVFVAFERRHGPFGLGHGLVGHHQHITGGRLDACSGDGSAENPGEIVSGPDLTDPDEWVDLDHARTSSN
jgi:hypothetical protein